VVAIALASAIVTPVMAAPQEKLPAEIKKMAEEKNWTYVGTVVLNGALSYHFKDAKGDHYVSVTWLEAMKHDQEKEPKTKGDVTIQGTAHQTSHAMWLAAWTIYQTFCTFRQLCTDVNWLISQFSLYNGEMREPDEYGTIVCDIINGYTYWR
jgi:hypothetical protein